MENDLESTATEFTETFIGASTFEDTTICDDLIEYFERNPHELKQGRSGESINLSYKNSLDRKLNEIEPSLCERYTKQLMNPITLYIKKYNFCNDIVNTWGLTDAPQFQKYLPNGGFYGWHCERERSSAPGGTRHLVYMTYLNDVHDGGETEFFYQKVKIKPRKGLTLIWPTDWTHTHRGIPSPSETKCIVTGWFNFI